MAFDPPRCPQQTNEVTKAMSAKILDEWIPQGDLAEELNCSERTIRRWRDLPDGLSYLTLAGRKYYHRDAVREFLARHVRHPNPRGAAT